MPYKDKEKVAAYYLANKERICEYARTYHRENHASKMIKHWRKQGHCIPEGTEHAAYTRFSETTHCEFCSWELVTGGRNRSNTKVRHHDHDIEGEDNFIAVICNVCNLREKCTNTSGESHISYVKRNKRWQFRIIYCGKRYEKATFKTFEQAVAYKGEWFSLNSPNAFHDPSWICELPQ